MDFNDESKSASEELVLIKRQGKALVDASGDILEHLGLSNLDFSRLTLQKLDYFSSVRWELFLETNECNIVTAFRDRTWQKSMRNKFTTMLELHVHELKTWLEVSRTLNGLVARLSDDYENCRSSINRQLKEVESLSPMGNQATLRFKDADRITKRKTLQTAIVAKCRDLSKKKTALSKVDSKLEQYCGLPTDLKAIHEKIVASRKELENVRESYETYFNSSLL